MPNDAIIPFTLAVAQADLEDLNRRIDQTRWPVRTVDPYPARMLSSRCSVEGVPHTSSTGRRGISRARPLVSLLQFR